MITERPRAGDGSTRSDQGYALVAAVAAILLFATVALFVLGITQRAVTTGRAEIDAVRAAAAADAGIALAIRGLLSDGSGNAFPIDGSPRQFRFDGATLAIEVRDERGKVPLNLLEDRQLNLLLESAGLSGEPLAVARDSFLDWIDEDDEARPFGAERDDYRRRGIIPRNAPFLTIGELGQVRGFTPSIVERIATLATADFGSGSFELRTATPAAIRIMYPDGDAAVDEILRAREAQQQVTALDFTDRVSRIARPMTITVRVSTATGARKTRRCLVELTGQTRRTHIVRHCT